MRAAYLLSMLCLVLACGAASADTPRRVAVTFDDLPWAGATARADQPSWHDAMLAALHLADVRGVAFVNEQALEVDGVVDPARVRMLRDWLDAGWELGNHTYAHVDLHAVGVDAYRTDILRGERVLRPLLAERDAVPRWFRHPYLRAGRSAEEKAAVAGFLAVHGYRIAPVTVDNSDWIWARAYEAALASDDGVAQARLRREFVPYLLAKLDYYEAQAQALLGRPLPQVLLLHANALNASTFVALADAMRARGYAFVSLAEALADPAYARADGYTGAFGPSWLHRWAIAERKPREFFAGEPETPRWVLDLAGVEAE